MKALLIEVLSWSSGERAGIETDDIREGKVIASPTWQELDTDPRGNYEVRLVKTDEYDLSEFDGEIVLEDGTKLKDAENLESGDKIEDVNGVVVLDGDQEINKVVKAAIEKTDADGNERKPDKVKNGRIQSS